MMHDHERKGQKMPTMLIRLVLTCACLFFGTPLYGAILSPVPSPEITGGSPEILGIANLGVPSEGFWAVPLMEWLQTDEVTIEVAVTSTSGDPSLPRPYPLFLTTTNNTPQAWNRFEIEVNGPASISLGLPPSIALPSGPPMQTQTDNTIVFDGLDWPGADPAAGFGIVTISFGLDVVPPLAGEPVRLTLRPIAVPEPSSALLLGIGGLVLCRSLRPRRVPRSRPGKMAPETF